MYSPKITLSQLEVAQRSLDFTLSYSPLKMVDQYVAHLNSLINLDRWREKREIEFRDPERQGRLMRGESPFEPDEEQWIKNEKTIATFDYTYFASRYSFITDSLGKGLVHYVPNIAQRILNDIRSEMEELYVAICLFQLKARQAGISTDNQVALTQRALFWPDTHILTASSDPEKTSLIHAKMELVLEHIPYWMFPKGWDQRKTGEHRINGGEMRTKVTLQHGTQESGMMRGDTVTCAHITEVPDFNDPDEDIDSSLIKAMHFNPETLFCMESTGKWADDEDYWFKKWRKAERLWPQGKYRFRPFFLPWFISSDIYPTPAEVRQFFDPIRSTWKPQPLTIAHAMRARETVDKSTFYQKYLGKDWKMPLEQMWFWEWDREQAKEDKRLGKWLSEMPACVTADARISTSDGFKQIGSAKYTRRVETGVVSEWLDNGVRPVMQLTTKMGRELTATYDHKFAMIDGSWKQLQHLQIGDKLRLSPPTFPVTPHLATWNHTPTCEMSVEITEDWGRFIGYFMGDGNWGNNSVDIACDAKDVDVIDDCAALMERLMGNPPSRQRVGGMVRLRHSNTRWREIMLNLDCIEPVITKSQKRGGGFRRKVCVPDIIWRSPKKVVRQFLAALFECDGHAYQQCAATRFFSKSEQFIKDIQLLLLGFSINSFWAKHDKIAGDGHKYIGRLLQLNALASDEFHDKIDFIGKRKCDARRTKKKANCLPHLMEDEVLLVEKAGKQAVYDITVEDVHCFGANGILVHNSPDDAFQPPGTSIFDTELIQDLRNSVKQPLAAFDISGEGITPRMRPQGVKHDMMMPPIPVTFHSPKHQAEFKFLPLMVEDWTTFSPNGKFIIWELPMEDEEYYFSLDSGLGVEQDATICDVLRKGDGIRPDEQVAQFASNLISGEDFDPLALAIGQLYSVVWNGGQEFKQPEFIPELAKGGKTCMNNMRMKGWRNIYVHVPLSNKIQDASKVATLGWPSNQVTRDEVVGEFIKAARERGEYQYLQINSRWTINEMATFGINPRKRKLEALGGAHDDRIFGIALPHWAANIFQLRGRGETPWERRRRQSEKQDAQIIEYSYGIMAQIPQRRLNALRRMDGSQFARTQLDHDYDGERLRIEETYEEGNDYA